MTNHYIRQGATGNNTGTDWTNAWTQLPSTLFRGDTYYIADGSYGNYEFDDAISGTLVITIRKATIADHGTDIGWSDSYGDEVAVFTNWFFETNYWDIDGQVGQSADDMSDYIPYGFTVATSNTYSNQHLITIGTWSIPGSYISIQHANIYFTNTDTWSYYSNSNVYIISTTNISIKYCWMHRAEQNVIGMYGWSNTITIDHCVIEECGSGQAIMNYDPYEHSANIRLSMHVKNLQFSNNIIRRWRYTGALVLYGDNDNINIYGNLFYCDADGGNLQGSAGYCNMAGTRTIDGVGIKADLEGQSYEGIYIHNNVFYDVGTGSDVPSLPSGLYTTEDQWTDVVIKNNIFYNISNMVYGVGNRSYNWYYNSGNQSETGVQIGTEDPFVNRSLKNHHLKNPTNSGSFLPAPFNIDPDGNTRGADGVWDRGAYEYISTPECPTPIVTFNLNTT